MPITEGESQPIFEPTCDVLIQKLSVAAFMAVLEEHRRLLEQQREDIEITLAEIAQHEARCRSLLAGAAPRAPATRPRRKALA